MNLHLALGIALLALSAACARWAFLAASGDPRLPEGGRYWDWNLWACFQWYSALLGGAYFVGRGLGYA